MKLVEIASLVAFLLNFSVACDLQQEQQKHTITSVKDGGVHAIFRTSEGVLYAWGFNDQGQCGVGEAFRYVNTPNKIALSETVTDVACGAMHTVAVAKPGVLWGWGNNQEQQLRSSQTNHYYQPVRLSRKSRWKSVAANSHYSMALTKSDRLFGWGRYFSKDTTPTESPHRAAFRKLGNRKWDSVRAGGNHALAMDKHANVWFFSFNPQKPRAFNLEKDVIKIEALGKCKALSAAMFHSLVVTDNGELWRVVSNDLGKPSISRIGNKDSWVAAFAGESNLALQSDKTWWGWGSNRVGELGLGDRNPRKKPVKIAFPRQWKVIETSESKSFGVSEQGNVYGWGELYFLTRERATKPNEVLNWTEHAHRYAKENRFCTISDGDRLMCTRPLHIHIEGE